MRFSIVIPTYNRAHFLSTAIKSVLNQRYTDWELIVVDDGSTDNTKEVVMRYNDKRIKYIYQENAERSVARNNGIKQAKGEYICFLDSDDYYLPEKLSNFKKAIEKLELSPFLFYDGLILEFQEKRSFVKIPKKNNAETTHEFLLQNPIGPLQVCGRRELFIKNMFNPNLRIGEDVELWLRMANHTEFIAVDSYQTSAIEHDDRSVNLKKYNSAKEQLKQLELIFSNYTTQQISKKVRGKVLSNCYFNSAKHYMLNGMKTKAMKEIIHSIFTDLKHHQLKHRVYCLLKLLFGKIPFEYQRS